MTAVAIAAPARAATVVSLTFDDGQASQYAVKAPLAAHGMDATFYLNSVRVGTSDYYMTWPQVEALAADGHEMGGHSLTHPDLTTLSDAQKRTEVCDDRQNLVARGLDPKSFAYPYGATDASVEAVVRDCGYLSARGVGGIVSPSWCPMCGSPRAESIPPENAYDLRTPSFGGEITLSAVQNVIIEAERSGGWVPLLFQGVCQQAPCESGWIRADAFSALLAWLAPRAAHGTVVKPVSEVIANAPPETSIDSKPPSVTAERSASFTLSANRSPVTFECSLDFGAWEPCAQSVSYSDLTVGGHSFRARARDQLGATDPTPAAWTWTVELEPGAGTPTVVSLTFDDGQATQYQLKQTLAEHGMRGTFFLNSGDICTIGCHGAWNMTWEQVQALAADGHEIAGHTLTHVDLTDGTIPLAERRRQVCEDFDALAARGFDPVSFAYPFGHSDATAEAIVEECGYVSARGAGGAPASGETIPPLNPFRTRTPGHSSGELTLSEFQQQVTRAEDAGGGWVQLAFHGVCETGCGEGWVKPATFAALLDWLESRASEGTVVRTVREVMGRTPPETAIVSGPSGTVASSSASFGFSSTNGGVEFECRLDAGAWESCAAPKAYSGLGEGQHTFAVRAVSRTGDRDPSPATRTWTVDTVAPETTITAGPSGAATSSAAEFAFSSAEAGSSFECSLDGGAWTACQSPKSYTGLGEGPHTFAVRAIDAAGNSDATPASRAWSVDTSAPDTEITAGPAGEVAASTASFEFRSGDAGARFECKLDAGAWEGCTSPKAYAAVADGDHTFSVRAIDDTGNADPSPATRTWTVDTVAAGTSIDSGPAGSVSSTGATFTFSSTDARARFECKLDAETWERCSSPKSFAGLAQGAHTFAVKSIDRAGNTDSTPATRTWTVDTVVPDTHVTSGPDGPVASSAATFQFGSPEPGAVFECALDGGAWAPCESPAAYSGLSEGGHAFAVRARDAAGNMDASPAARSWSVDTIAPDTTLTDAPGAAESTATAEFGFTTGDATASFECRLDGGEWTACSSPRTYAGLGDGPHTFSVRAVDPVGNRDTTPVTHAWSVDTVAPDTVLGGGPSGTVSEADASFSFSSPEAGATFECKLDAGEWASCASPRSHTGLGDGAHSFSVRALDALGNADPSPASRSWIVDTTAPETSLTRGPSELTASREAGFDFTSPNQGATFECKLDEGAWAACASPKAYTGLADGTHTFSVRARDGVGNADPSPAAKTWTIDATAPETDITAGPTGTVTSRDAAFEFSASEAATFECRLDAGDWQPCDEPESYAGLAYGEHTFAVRARDALGNVEATPATRTWTIQTPPLPPDDPPPPNEEEPPPNEEEPPPDDEEQPTPPSGSGEEPAGSEDPDPAPPLTPDDQRPPAESDDSGTDADPAAAAYLRSVLEGAVRANKGKRLRRLVRTRKLRIELPHSDVRGVLSFEVFLLPDPPGPAPRLARVRTRAPIGSRMLDELKLSKRAKRRLAKLWVAAIEINATFTPDTGGVVHDRAVFLTRR